ncbi:Wzz/FepE/Etk N-terminal domain-containing protein, partial [Flavobacterium sp. LBUM151]
MQSQDFYNEIDNKSEDVNLRQQLDKYIIQWKWFLLSVVICLIAVFLYLRYATPIYEATTAILVKDEKKGGMLSELSAFSDLGLGGGSVNNVDNEIEILRSRTIVESTVKRLNLNINLIAEGNVVDRDIYADASISVNFINKSDLFNQAKLVLRYNSLTKNTFELTNEIDNENIILGTKKVFNYGEKIPTTLGILFINKTNNIVDGNSVHYKSIKIAINPVESVAESYKGRINVEPISKTSSVVNISITDPVQKRAEVFLDNMIQIYNQDAAQDKNFISENTSQ